MSTKRKFPEIASTKEGPKHSKRSWKAVTSAIQYYEEGKYDKALQRLFKYEEVEARAIFLLACMYLNGLGVDENMDTAASYMMKLVSFEHIRKEEEDLLALACYYLGDLYYRGLSVARDEKLAEKHWRQGAVLKDPETDNSYFGTMKCQTALGMFYSNSKLKKTKRAFYWHKRAVESGSIISEGALGVMYMYGIGTEEDMQLAYNHLTNAAVMDNIYGKGYLAAFYYKRQMYHRTVFLGRELAALEDYEMLAKRDDCNIEHVKQGIAVGCFYVALCMQYGYALEKSIPESKKLIKRALEISTDVIYDLHVNAVLQTL